MSCSGGEKSMYGSPIADFLVIIAVAFSGIRRSRSIFISTRTPPGMRSTDSTMP